MADPTRPATPDEAARSQAPRPGGGDPVRRLRAVWRQVVARAAGSRGVLAAALAATVVGTLLAWWGADRAAAVAWSVGPVLVLPGLALAVGRGLWRREPGVDVIALLAMGGALAAGEHLAGVIVAVMLTGGQALEAAAGDRAERELTALLAHAPRRAHLVVTAAGEGGEAVEQQADVDVEAVEPGAVLVVLTGEVVAVDGVLLGDAVLDESTLTGEARPVTRRAGDAVASGVVSVGPAVRLTATRAARDSTYAGIVRLVERARTSRAPFVRMADRYAAWFVPLALGVAGAAWAGSGDPVRALAVLVVATPCPLLLAAPIAITSGMSRAARQGVVVKHGGALEALAQVRTVCLDKTGTVTTGRPHLVDVVAADGADPDEVLRLAAAAERTSAHPFGPALVAAARERGLHVPVPEAAEEEPGEGVLAVVGGRRVAVGSAALVRRADRAGGPSSRAGGPSSPEGAGPPQGAEPAAMASARRRAALEGASVAFVAVDGRYAGALHVEDPLRGDAPRMLRQLRRAGVERTVLLTGDHAAVAEAVGLAVGVDAVLAERTPAEKVAAVAAEAARAPTAMVGDGVNDAPALAAAQVGIAMGARGATASGEAADVVITVDRIDRVVDALRIARRTRAIARQSAAVGMGLASAAMAAAALGLLSPVPGAVLQEGIDVAAILNALRVLRVRTRPVAPPQLVARSEALLAVHEALAGGVAAIRRAADRLDDAGPAELAGDLAAVRTFLADVLLPHEREEQAELDALVRTAHGGEDVTGAFPRAHREVERLARRLDAQVEALGGGRPVDPAALQALRPTLYGLHTLLAFQLAQEEEVYALLAGHGGRVPAGIG